MPTNEKLLECNNLRTYFHTENGVARSVDGVSFSLNKGETLGIVGESGSGKSVTSLSIMRLIERPGKIEGGEILLEGKDINKVSMKEMRKIRGDDIAMIFQEPLTSLNPVFTIGNQMSETIILHQKASKAKAKELSIKMLEKVGIPRADKVFSSYPHSLSGGMRQRVMIAMALSCNPKLLIADEPTTALDMTIQAQILKLMKNLTRESNTSIMLITHDLGVIAEMADRVIVMYGGQVVEQTDVYTLFDNPKHPYTKGLLESTPKIHESKEELESIQGTVPNPYNFPKGCKFATRCPYVMDHCWDQEPKLEEIKEGQEVRCWLHEKEVVNL